MILVTGGAGFIGANFVLDWIATEGTPVVNLDKLTYAGNPANLAPLKGDGRYIFAQGDINDRALVASLLKRHQPQAVVLCHQLCRRNDEAESERGGRQGQCST